MNMQHAENGPVNETTRDEATESGPSLKQYDKVLKTLEHRVAKLEKGSANIRILALDRAVQEMVQELFSYITPADPVGLAFERVGRAYDGGYIMVKHEAKSRTAYSLGINRDVSWDLAMAERGYDVYQYDHTIIKLPVNHPRFHFRRLGITGMSLVNDELSSLEIEIANNAHSEHHDMILKIDIEGHEWDVFNEIPEEDLSRFTQILIECHGFSKMHKLFWYRKARQALQRLATSHQVVHVHGNNNSPMVVLGGVAVPQTLELTWLRRDICEFAPCTRNFPTDLDQPNNPNYADHRLGRFSFF
ncbi:hypothetical protein PMI07_001437 [Rhizobium sp. CF080]|uniref:FkbM family methyltransferase n=1 Tax=Rhizobium sp. (strain CF080) TaxID=1144310 RepID=UPI0002719A3B|nr:FkbM family methyltransferase [Rhizobium sp. CF080]EUB96538.1 hypothetical protein PMI07_001437 [Rhizobium sp. CF080]